MLTKKYKESYLAKVLEFLFEDNLSLKFSDTLLGKFLAKISFPVVSNCALIVSVILFWYKDGLVRFSYVIGISWLPLLFLAVSLLTLEKSKLVIKKMHLWFLAFLVALLFSSIFGLMIGVSRVAILMGFVLFSQLFLAILVGQSLKAESLNRALLGISIPAILLSIYQFFILKTDNSLWVSAYESGNVRASAFFGSPNVLGILMAFISFLSIGMFLRTRSKIYIIAGALSFFSMTISLSRAAWLGFLVAAIVMIMLNNVKLLYLGLLMPLALFSSVIRQRVIVLFNPSFLFDSSLDGRIWSLMNGLYLAKKYPFGTGLGSYGGELALKSASPVYLQGIQNGYTALYFADNQYVELLVQGGFFGLILFIGFLVSVICALLKKAKENGLALAALGAFITFAVSGMFANVLEFSAIAVPLGLIIGSNLND